MVLSSQLGAPRFRLRVLRFFLPRCVLRVCVVLLALLVLRVPLEVLVPVLLVGGWGCESEGVPNREVEFRVASLRFALRDVS